MLLSYSSILISYILPRDEKKSTSFAFGRTTLLHRERVVYTQKNAAVNTQRVRPTHASLRYTSQSIQQGCRGDGISIPYPPHTHTNGDPTWIPYPRQTCHLDVGTATGTHMPYRITQCYLPPGTGDIPALMGLLQLRYEHDSSTIRLRFDYDSSAIQHPTRSYALSSNNEHVNSFPLL